MKQAERSKPAPTPKPRRASTPTARRRRRPSLGRNEFLAKALEVFCEKGFDGASIDAITAAAGIAKRTVYARYGDKENLFKAAIERAIDDWNVPVERLRAAETDDLEESLLAIGSILVANILTPAGLRLMRLTNAESGRMPAVGEHNVRYGEAPVLAYLADLFRRKVPGAGRDFDSAAEAAEVFLHLVVGGPASAAAWGVVRDKDAIERQTRLSIRIFLHGLLSESEARSATNEPDTLKNEMAELKSLLAQACERLDRASAELEPSA